MGISQTTSSTSRTLSFISSSSPHINLLLVPPPYSPATSNYHNSHTLSIRHTNTIMPADAVRSLSATNDVERIEAPVTWQAYMMCAFASFGGIFFGYDSGYINGVTGSEKFIELIEGPRPADVAPADYALSGSHLSLITSILSAGTFFGAIIAGDIADIIGRKWTIITGCLIYIVGVVLQVATNGLGLIVAGRLVAGLGVGFESAIVILYMSEICPKKVRGQPQDSEYVEAELAEIIANE